MKWWVTGYDISGRVLVQTWHTSIGSAQIEVEAWKSRIARPGDPAVECEIIHADKRVTRVKYTNLNERIDWGSYADY